MPVRDVTMKQVYCDMPDCNVPGPLGVTESGVTWDAQMVGWECVFGVTLCPRCSAQGRLPSDADDIRVTLPAAADNAVVVVTEDDGEGM